MTLSWISSLSRQAGRARRPAGKIYETFDRGDECLLTSLAVRAFFQRLSLFLSTHGRFDRRRGVLSAGEESRRVIRDTLVSHVECGLPARSIIGQQSEKRYSPGSSVAWNASFRDSTRTRTRETRIALSQFPLAGMHISAPSNHRRASRRPRGTQRAR